MHTKQGIVERVASGKVYIRVKPDGCGTSCNSCGIASGAKDSKLISVASKKNFSIGDKVTIEISEFDVLINGLVCYGLPVVALLLSASIMTYVFNKSDVVVAIISLIVTASSWFIIKLYEPRKVSIILDNP